jgi:hypothetical protein
MLFLISGTLVYLWNKSTVGKAIVCHSSPHISNQWENQFDWNNFCSPKLQCLPALTDGIPVGFAVRLSTIDQRL